MTDRIVQLGNVTPTKTRANPNQGRVYDTRGLCPCLNSCGGGNLQPFIIVEVKDGAKVFRERV